MTRLSSLVTYLACIVCIGLVTGCATSHQPGAETGSPVKTVTQAASINRIGDPGSLVARAALNVLGTPYSYGGDAVGGFDCSGLVQYAHAQAGIRIPRTTGQQYEAAKQPARLRVGDVLFFRIKGRVAHNGIYIGDGRFIHAPSTGKNVKISRTDNPYFRKRLAGVRRFN